MALSDESCATARPLGILRRSNRRNDFRRIREICRQHAIALILVGNPLDSSGNAGEMAGEAQRFAHRLSRELGIPVQLEDERLTSWEAQRILRERKPRQNRQRDEDDLAAAVMLRDFLSRASIVREPNPQGTRSFLADCHWDED